MKQEQYVRDRLDDQIRWYGDKAAWNQRWFRRLQLAQIGLGALIPFASGAAGTLLAEGSAWPGLSSGFLGVLVAFTGGVLALYSFQENWVSYRGTAEALKREKVLFQAGVEHYRVPEAFEVLVQRSESIMSSENTNWIAAQEGEGREG
jgi:hypothetical protein